MVSGVGALQDLCDGMLEVGRDAVEGRADEQQDHWIVVNGGEDWDCYQSGDDPEEWTAEVHKWAITAYLNIYNERDMNRRSIRQSYLHVEFDARRNTHLDMQRDDDLISGKITVPLQCPTLGQYIP